MWSTKDEESLPIGSPSLVILLLRPFYHLLHSYLLPLSAIMWGQLLFLALSAGPGLGEESESLRSVVTGDLETYLERENEPTVIKQGSWSKILRKVSPSIDQIMNFCSAKHQHGDLVCLAHCTVFYGTQNVVKVSRNSFVNSQ